MTLEKKIEDLRKLIRKLEKRRRALTDLEVEQLERGKRILKNVERFYDRQIDFHQERLKEISEILERF